MLVRFAFLTLLAVAIPALWYVATRAWFESGSGFLYAIFFPDSEWVFAWPLLAFVAAWWLLAPRPRLSSANFLFLPVAAVGGLLLGMFLGLGFSCGYLQKCM